MADDDEPCAKGWHSRRYLPHCDAPGLIQSVTFRLADALPKSVIERVDQKATDDADKQKRIEAWLDTGHGSCLLRDPANAGIVEAALLHFDSERYGLLAWCIMPNHVHALIETFEPRSTGETAALRHGAGSTGVPPAKSFSLGNIVHSWKSFTAHEINRTLEREGTVWQREYFDRYIRDDRHLATVMAYIHDNPVEAGLVDRAALWPFSSARHR